MKITFAGNARPPHSTENHVARALRANRHAVRQVQESDPAAWARLAERGPEADLFLWTRTAWDWRAIGADPERIADLQRQTLDRCREQGVPSVGYHLDRWWGLAREHEVMTEPFFRVSMLATADGGHDEQWQTAGVSHVWLPPAVSEPETRPGTFRRHLASEVAFVGSWQGRYHPEWPHRADLVAFLMHTYGSRVKFWPQPGRPALRGQVLRDLYASVKVLVGDSCLAGEATHYVSDRLPETLGRGGYLVHPDVTGVTDGTHYTAGHHLGTWTLGQWDELREKVDLALADDEGRKAVAKRGRAHVLANHTYEIRVRELLALVPVLVS